MIAVRYDTRELEFLGRSMRMRSTRLRSLIVGFMPRFTADAEAIGVEEIKAVTPIGKPGESTSDYEFPEHPVAKLRDSTKPVSTVDGTRSTVAIIQDAQSEPNADGSGGGYHYGYTVRKGRDAISAPSAGPYSTGKRALAGPGFGPVKRVGPAAARPYQEEATPRISGALAIQAQRYGREMLMALMGAA